MNGEVISKVDLDLEASSPSAFWKRLCVLPEDAENALDLL